MLQECNTLPFLGNESVFETESRHLRRGHSMVSRKSEYNLKPTWKKKKNTSQFWKLDSLVQIQVTPTLPSYQLLPSEAACNLRLSGSWYFRCLLIRPAVNAGQVKIEVSSGSAPPLWLGWRKPPENVYCCLNVIFSIQMLVIARSNLIYYNCDCTALM